MAYKQTNTQSHVMPHSHDISDVNGLQDLLDSGLVYQGNTAPENPTTGKLWYDTTTKIVKVYTGENWVNVGPEIYPMTKAEYEALSEAEKNSGKFFFITDNDGTIIVDWANVENKPEFSAVATSGAISDLSGTSDNIAEGSTNLFLTTDERNRMLKVGGYHTYGSGESTWLMVENEPTSTLLQPGQIGTYGDEMVGNTYMTPTEIQTDGNVDDVMYTTKYKKDSITVDMYDMNEGESSITYPYRGADRIAKLTDIPEESNTKTFYLSGTDDLATAQEAYDWHLDGKNSILSCYDLKFTYSEYYGAGDSINLRFVAPAVYSGDSVDGYSIYVINFIEIEANRTTKTVTGMYLSSWNFNGISVSNPYQNAFIPTEDYHPATKKYVDDSISTAIADFGGFEVITDFPEEPKTNIIYLKGPIGEGADKYEEWIYADGWTQIGETSVDLTNYVTSTEFSNLQSEVGQKADSTYVDTVSSTADSAYNLAEQANTAANTAQDTANAADSKAQTAWEVAASKMDGPIVTSGMSINNHSQRSNRGPVMYDYHIPTKQEWESLKSIMNNLGLTTGDLWRKSLHMPFAGSRYIDGNIMNKEYIGNYWTSTPDSERAYRAYYFKLTSADASINNDGARASGFSLRLFCDDIYDPAGEQIFEGATEGTGIWLTTDKNGYQMLIVSDGTNTICMQAMNQGTWEIYNDGDELTEANCGFYFQWGNNGGFAFEGNLETSNEQVDTEGYADSNYYGSPFVAGFPNWASPSNNKLWGIDDDGNYTEKWVSSWEVQIPDVSVNWGSIGGDISTQGDLQTKFSEIEQAVDGKIGKNWQELGGDYIGLLNTKEGYEDRLAISPNLTGSGPAINMWKENENENYDTTYSADKIIVDGDVDKEYTFNDESTGIVRFSDLDSRGLTILSYGSSTWNDFITAYNNNQVVYCRASGNDNPANGAQTRLAFMAYVNQNPNPTSVEFQYYRSKSSHNTESDELDEVYVYTLKKMDSSNYEWSVTRRDTGAKTVAGTGINVTYSNGNKTITNTGVTSVNGQTGAVTISAPTYTAGTGLALSGTEFSVDTTSIATQSDIENLQTNINSKQDELTAGENISIVSGVISATDTKYTAGENVSIEEKQIMHSDMQGPAPDGFHVPLKEEWEGLKSIMTSLGLTTGDQWKMYLHIPFANLRSSSKGTYGYYWSSSPYSAGSNAVYYLFLAPTSVNLYNSPERSEGRPVRCFKNSYVEPDGSWAVVQGTLGGAGIFWNQSKGLISITDGSTGYTIMDKNLGATTVYNDGDTLSEANCGGYFQWGNNHMFPFSGNVTTSAIRVDASGYGPGNYYTSDTYIDGYNDWSSVINNNLWGGVSQGQWAGGGSYLEISAQVPAVPDNVVVAVTQAEYDALTDAQKNDGVFRIIKDAPAETLPFIEVMEDSPITGVKAWFGTQAQYDALESVDPNGMYVILSNPSTNE